MSYVRVIYVLYLGAGRLFWSTFFEKKKELSLLAPPTHMLFLAIYEENISLEAQGTILGAIVALNKGLEQALRELCTIFYLMSFSSLLI